MPSTDKTPAGGLAADAEAAGMSVSDYIRACSEQWDAEHPEEANAERLRKQNAQLQYELAEIKEREAQAAHTRKNHRRVTIAVAVYFGGCFVLWLLFNGACPSCAWNGSEISSWWDFLAMFAYLGWSIGGIVAGWYVADRF